MKRRAYRFLPMEPADFNPNSSPVLSAAKGPTGKINNIFSETIFIPENDNLEDVRTTVSEILKISDDDSWNIVDTDGDLVMIHYDHDSADLSIYGRLRGVVVDIKRHVQVADSYGYTPTSVNDSLIPDNENKLVLVDQSGLTHRVNLDDPNFSIKYGLEGVLIRVFKWNGKIYHSSHRRFDVSRSRWGDSLPFLTIYKMLGGPEGNELFSEDEMFSPYVHFFLAEHPGLLHVTKNQVGTGFLYHLGFRKMWSVDPIGSPFRTTDQKGNPRLVSGQTVQSWSQDTRENVGFVNSTIYIPKTRSTIPTFIKFEERVKSGASPEIISLPDLSIGEANTLLRYGYYKPYNDATTDFRLRTGEFVVIYKSDGTLLRVESGAYRWRANTTDDNPNRRHRFYQLTDAATRLYPNHLERFRRLFPPMNIHKVEHIKTVLSKGPILLWNQLQGEPNGKSRVKLDDSQDSNKLNELRTLEKRIYNVWACLLIASPVNRQAEVVDYYQQYFTDQKLVIDWISKLRKEGYPEGVEEPESKLVTIIDRVNRQTQARISRRNPRDTKLNYDQIFKQQLTFQIKLEPGHVEYRLVILMEKSQTDN